MSEELAPRSLGDVEPGMRLRGTVRQVQLGGAIIDVGLEECNAFLHISQIRRRRRIKNVSDVLAEGQRVTVWVLTVDKEKGRLDVTMVQPPAVSWDEIAAGQVYRGQVVRIEKFGVFVDFGAERPGLVHVSNLAHNFVSDPGQLVQKGQEVEVQVIGVDRQKNQIDLSMKALSRPVEPEPEQEEQDDTPETAMALAWRRAQEDSSSESLTSSSGTRRAEKVRREQNDIQRRTLERHQGR